MTVSIQTLMAGPYEWVEVTGATTPIVISTSPIRLLRVILSADNAYRWCKIWHSVNGTNQISRVDATSQNTETIRFGTAGFLCSNGLSLSLSHPNAKAYPIWVPEQ